MEFTVHADQSLCTLYSTSGLSPLLLSPKVRLHSYPGALSLLNVLNSLFTAYSPHPVPGPAALHTTLPCITRPLSGLWTVLSISVPLWLFCVSKKIDTTPSGHFLFPPGTFPIKCKSNNATQVQGRKKHIHTAE